MSVEKSKTNTQQVVTMNYPKAQLYLGEGETGGGKRTAGGEVVNKQKLELLSHLLK